MKRILCACLLLAACAESPAPVPAIPAAPPPRTTRVVGLYEDMAVSAQAFCGEESWSLRYTTFDHTEAVATCSGYE